MKFSLEKSIEILERTPTVINALLNNISDDWFMNNEGDNTWTPKEVLAHLIVCEDTDWLPRINIILKSPEIVFDRIDMDVHLELASNNSIKDLLKSFTEKRIKRLHELDGFKLSSNDLAKIGLHPEVGEITLQQIISTWVTHDLSHLSQITRVMAKQNANLVGPSIKFLNLLK